MIAKASALGIVLLLAAASLVPARADVVSVHDATGRTVRITDPSRIVSIGGAVTETLYALGQQHRIVAVDTTSLFPPQAMRDKPNVGYVRQLSPEGVLGLHPTLILAIEGAGPKEAVEVIESAGIPFVHVPDRFTADGVIERMRLIAAATQAISLGDCLIAQVQKDFDALAAARARVRKPARVLFVLSFVNGRAMVAGRNTAADGIIALAGAVNAMSQLDGYKPVSDESILAAQPDAVLTMQRPNQTITADEVFGHPAFVQTKAAARHAFLSYEGLYLLGFGPRTAAAARELAHALYPDLVTAPADRATTFDSCRR